MGSGIEGELSPPLRARDEAFGEWRARCRELKNQCAAASIFPQQPGAADGEASFLLGALSEHDPAVINPLATLQDLLLRERDTDLRPDALDERIIEAAESFGEERESPEPVEELPWPVRGGVWQFREPPEARSDARSLGIHHALRLLFPERRRLRPCCRETAPHQILHPQTERVQPGGYARKPLLLPPFPRHQIRRGGLVSPLRAFAGGRSGGAMGEPVRDPVGRGRF